MSGHGNDDYATGQVTIGTSPTLIRAGHPTRHVIGIINYGPTDVYVGKEDVTTTTGLHVKGNGTSVSAAISGPLWGVVASGTQSISYMVLIV